MDNNEALQLILSEIVAMKTEMKSINSRLDSIETRLESIEDRLETLEDRLETLEDCVGSLETRADSMEANIIEIKERVIIIENDHGQQLRALFDSYQLLYEISGDIRSSIGKMQAEQEKHDLYIKWLDSERKKTG